MVTRIAIVNRGEAAMRLIHHVREVNAGGETCYETIALHTREDRGAPFVQAADITYDLGPASARPYLDHAVLEVALTATGAQLAWPGWGFVAEDASFAELCERLGVVFVGPSPQAMRALGDKIGAKLLAESVSVPVADWSNGPIDDIGAALTHAHRIGYPLMLKAASGGGGRGIRLVSGDDDLIDVFQRTREEARRSFGSDVVFLERLVTGARHVEVQLIADGQGTAWALGVRDCSVQRKHQKLIEESASVVLSDEQVAELQQAAVRLALSVGYRGAGTAEFLYQPSDRTFAFLEVNTRLQVEHPVTELVTGTDLVGLQLHVAGGGRLDGPPPRRSGHAIEVRLNAEDPDRDFAPAPGRISYLRMPVGPGIRVDTGVAEGDTIPPDFDSMIAKIIVSGATREIALARMRRALFDTTVIVEGGITNKAFLLDLLQCPDIINGSADTGWIDRTRAAGGLRSTRNAGVALIAAAVDAYQEAEALDRATFLFTARSGRPQARVEAGCGFDFVLRQSAHRLEVARVGPTTFRVEIDGVEQVTELHRLDAYTGRLTLRAGTGSVARQFRVVVAGHGAEHQVDVDGSVHRIARHEGGVVRSPFPALVVSVPVAVGDTVEADQPILVLESMKMETVITAPAAGRLTELLVSANDQVGPGETLLRFEALDGDDADGANGPGVRAAEPGAADDLLPVPAETDPDVAALDWIGELRSSLLGFDVPAERQEAAIRGYADAGTATHPALAEAELDLLTVFADLCELARDRPGDEDGRHDRVHSPREFFHRYLRSLDPDREQLPAGFQARLAAMLAHYGVTGLDRDLEGDAVLEAAVFRVFLALQTASVHVPAVTAVLDRWVTAALPDDELAQRVHAVLDRLVIATQLPQPAVAELARSVRFRRFDAPLADAARTRSSSQVRAHLDWLAAHQGQAPGEERVRRITGLATVSDPLIALLTAEIAEAGPLVADLLEVMLHRHYREHGLADVTVAPHDRHPLVSAEYTIDRRSRLISTAAQIGDLESALTRLDTVIDDRRNTDVVVELYLDLGDAEPHAQTDDTDDTNDPDRTHRSDTDPDAWSSSLSDQLGRHSFARRTKRITVTVAGRDGDGEVLRLTYRPVIEDGPDADQVARTDEVSPLAEDLLLRGLHPMVARRLDLWRLREFEVTRLASPEEVVLYRCVAPGNSADVRLVALAQVRELTLARDGAGTLTALPQIESVLAIAMDAIGQARAASPSRMRSDHNHIWAHVWPTIEATPDELTGLRDTLVPLTLGAGVQEALISGKFRAGGGSVRPGTVRVTHQVGAGVQVRHSDSAGGPLEPIDDYALKVLRARRRGAIYPYELVHLLCAGGEFVEYDLGADGVLAPIRRQPGRNEAALVVGTVTATTDRFPDGITRVVLLGDPTKALGAVAEAECSRLLAALDLADELGVPVEWFAISAGAQISMTSGTENMDWVARGLRRIIEFTQAGGEINVVVAGITVGAQPYWTAEATMLMHTRGILVMTPDSAMVLTGKQSLDYSGGVSAEDNLGIGGYDRVMGPNGQAQYWARDLAGAVDVLFTHYEHTYLPRGERFPPAVISGDPRDRDVCRSPHHAPDGGFPLIGDIFSARSNPERKKPFDIRSLMRAVADQDFVPQERWAGMADADTSVVFDAHLGGYPICLLGIESRAVPRHGFPPSDGPSTWTAGTLFPSSSKKTARAINAASGNRPLVVLANLSGFDGSPESMRLLQLEYGAEIGRAVVNFAGPIVFCVVSRYHGGAFVVFSKVLNDNMTVLAVEGSFASVIGGAPAAAVVFRAEVDSRTRTDSRIKVAEQQAAAADEPERSRLRAEMAKLRDTVYNDKLRDVATEFDAVHSIERAVKVGSVDAVISAPELRPRLIEAVEEGMARTRR